MARREVLEQLEQKRQELNQRKQDEKSFIRELDSGITESPLISKMLKYEPEAYHQTQSRQRMLAVAKFVKEHFNVKISAADIILALRILNGFWCNTAELEFLNEVRSMFPRRLLESLDQGAGNIYQEYSSYEAKVPMSYDMILAQRCKVCGFVLDK